MTEHDPQTGRWLDEYTPEIGDRICAEMIAGEDGRPQSLNAVLRQPGMPSKKTVMRWLNKHPDFEKIYTIAQQERSEGWIEEIVEIADDSSRDYVADADGNLRVDKEHINRSRLRVDTRKWYASKMKPKRYGDRVSAELTGADGKDLIPETTDLKEIARLMAFLLTAADKKDEEK